MVSSQQNKEKSNVSKLADVGRSVFALGVLMLVCSPHVRAQTLHYQQAVNNTGAPRDDLHVVVTHAVTGTKFKAPPFTRQSITPGTLGRGMDFDQGVVNPGEVAGVRWVNVFKEDMIQEGYWTLGGVRKEPIKTNPVVSQPNVLPDGTSILVMNNTSDAPVPYTGLMVVNGADINSFNVNDFDAAFLTGMQVETFVPADGMLPPGNTTVARFPASRTGFMGASGNFDGQDTAVGWTVDRTGSTIINFGVGTNDRSAASAIATDGNIFLGGGSQVGAPTGQISGAIAGFLNFGSSDQGFGTGGLVTDNNATDTHDYWNAIVLSDTGANQFEITGGASNSLDGTSGFFAAEYLPDGSLNPNFASAGHFFFKFAPGTHDQINAVLPLRISDGTSNTLLAGESCQQPPTPCQDAMVRLDGVGNIVLTKLDNNAKGIVGAAPAPNNAFYALVQKDNAMGRQAFAAGRYSVISLDLDVAYGTLGIAQNNFGPNTTDVPNAIAADGQGNVYIVGSTFQQGAFTGSVGVMKLTSAGSLDTTYGNGGKFTFQIGFSSQALSGAFDVTGKLLVAGAAQMTTGSPISGFVARLNTNGTLDTSFNGTGIVQWPVPDNNVFFSNVIAESFTNSVIATGTALNLSNNGSFIAVKLLANGTPDSGFGNLKP